MTEKKTFFDSSQFIFFSEKKSFLVKNCCFHEQYLVDISFQFSTVAHPLGKVKAREKKCTTLRSETIQFKNQEAIHIFFFLSFSMKFNQKMLMEGFNIHNPI